MHWVVQSNMFNEEGFGRLLAALVRMDVPYTCVKVVPFSHELVPDINPSGPVVIMGTYTLANIARARGWTPGSFDNENFDYWVQSFAWPKAMLNADMWRGRFEDVPERRKPFFIRPLHDTKSFIGQVMDWEQFQKFRAGVLALKPEDQPTVTADTQVLVAHKKEIWSETRVWMVDGKAVTASLYKFGTIKRYDDGVPVAITRFAEELARRWTPSRAYVVDIADTPEGLKVVEVNNLNCAGFYAGDMQKLVAAIEGMK
jgi:hypothetical protein